MEFVPFRTCSYQFIGKQRIFVNGIWFSLFFFLADTENPPVIIGIQQFQGVVLYRRGKGTNGESFSVRKVSNGVGVERIFPLLTPSIDKIEFVRAGKVRRAKLTYLKGRQGKSARIKEKLAVSK